MISGSFTHLPTRSDSAKANLTDMETGYKVFTFGFEPEFTAKVAKNRFRVYEVPISYSGRDYSEGEKITWKDGFVAIWYIFRFRFLD